eukprot:3632033-Pleurochrysis_carterae.AAC.1
MRKSSAYCSAVYVLPVLFVFWLLRPVADVTWNGRQDMQALLAGSIPDASGGWPLGEASVLPGTRVAAQSSLCGASMRRGRGSGGW